MAAPDAGGPPQGVLESARDEEGGEEKAQAVEGPEREGLGGEGLHLLAEPRKEYIEGPGGVLVVPAIDAAYRGSQV